MSVYTTVTQAELESWLAQYTLGQLVELKGIAAGITNTNYFVTTTQGRYVLTLFETLKLEELPYYLNLMSHLARHGVACPAPMADRSDRFVSLLAGKPACLVSCLSGADVAAPNPAQCRAVGVMMADMHLAGDTYPARMANPRGPAWWSATAQVVYPHMDAADAAMLHEEVAFQSEHRFDALPTGVIHADLFRDNVMFDGETLTGFFDFYFAGVDTWLFDLAVCLNDWCIDLASGQNDSQRAEALLQAYQAVRPLRKAERMLLPAMLRAGALRFWISRLWDFHLPRDAAMLVPHDPTHFERVLRERQAWPLKL